MQMYQVNFHAHFANLIDVGSSIVCAADAEAATEMVAALLELPRSKTVFEVTRIKPSLYQIHRKEVVKPQIQKNGSAKKAEKNNTNDDRPHVFQCRVSASVTGRNEDQALRRLTDVLADRSSAQKSIIRAHTKNLIVELTQTASAQRELKAMEKVELYKAKHFF